MLVPKQLAWLVLGAAACGGGGTSTVDAPRATTGNLYLTVKDIGGQCTMTVDASEPFTSADETFADLTSGQTVGLTASATTGATLGLWHHTSHDTGSGDPGTLTNFGQGAVSSTSMTLGGTPGCVWICCSSGSDACPTADQCP